MRHLQTIEPVYELDYTIDLREKSKSSKGGIIANILIGTWLVSVNLFVLWRYHQRDVGDIVLVLSNICILCGGCFFLIKGIIGRDMLVYRKFITIQPTAIVIKEPFRKLKIFPIETIDAVEIKPSYLKLWHSGKEFSFSLRWINFREFRGLRYALESFCNQMKTDLN